MPRMVPWSERRQLCRTPIQQNWYQAAHVPDKFLDKVMEVSNITWSTNTPKNQLTIFELLEDIITETLPTQINDEYFDKFVEIKEVPKWEI